MIKKKILDSAEKSRLILLNLFTLAQLFELAASVTC